MTKGWLLIKIPRKYNVNDARMTRVYWIRPYCTIMRAISSVPLGLSSLMAKSTWKQASDSMTSLVSTFYF